MSLGYSPDGKQIRKYKTVEGTKEEAKEEMYKFAQEIKTGKYIDSQDITLNEYLDEWFDDYKGNIAPSTQDYYRIIINSHLKPYFKGIKLESLTPLHIKKYIRYKLDSGRLDNKSGGLSKKSTRRHYVVLNNALKYAVKWQLLEDNPAKIIDAPIPEKPEIQALTQEQLEKLLEAAEGVMHDVIYLAAYTGMRRGEIFGLRWKDIDFNDGRIQVRQAVSEIRGKGLVYRKPKTSGSIRPIEIDEDIINLLKKRRKTQKEFKMKLRDVYSNEKNLVFTWKDGKAYKPRYATRQFNKIAESVGLEEFRLHDLRHTHATLMLKANVHPKIVQERLGHNSISQTLDTYSHVIPSMQKEALKKMRNRMK